MFSSPDQIRCECGRLLAVRNGDRIEIKCRRCGRHSSFDVDALSAAPYELILRRGPVRSG